MKATSKKKTALITGASNGFGMELAKLFAKDGYNLVLVARSTDRLKKLGYSLQDEHQLEHVCIVTSDLTRPESAQEIYEEVKSSGIEIDVLVNNAGVGVHGTFLDNEFQRELDVIQLNVVSLVTLTKLFLPEMKLRNEGKILNLGSIVSLMPAPLMAIYGATKAFVLSFSEALANELKDTNITVTTLCPGAGNTDFFHKADAEYTKAANGPLSEPKDVARAGYEAMMKGEVKVVPGFMNKIQAAASNVIPDTALSSIMHMQMEEETKDAYYDKEA
ncbi:SDR family NAD(P)-dependent oxidoreductase [Pontibacter harenae]|uniref:SDR family NAD(P)-dependent oxidoreductase n=1 Tax=Pontibacter harenae TaxID=2894083 RepID=UPI001E56E127|nr:SDR family oxidoreductase [Pontibacter harenae]MCC9167060.1 SDR family oxidoreductase [Pontibacter harenae]